MTADLNTLKDSYLALRRSSGYRLDETEYHIRTFISWLDTERADRAEFTVADALEWACQHGGQTIGHVKRLGSIRGWTTYAHAHDPAIPVIPAGLLTAPQMRPAPYIYLEDDIEAVMEVFARRADNGRTWPSRWTDRTYQVLTGLLACTGMRVGEAIGLNRDQVDMDTGWIKVATEKTGRERLVLLHPTSLRELGAYLDDPARPAVAAPEPLFVSASGRRVGYTLYQKNFHAATIEADLKHQGRAKPTIHGLRHTFAVRQLAAAYREGADPARRLTLLSTWLGHVSPNNTYWYLTATPELLGGAADLVEQDRR